MLVSLKAVIRRVDPSKRDDFADILNVHGDTSLRKPYSIRSETGDDDMYWIPPPDWPKAGAAIPASTSNGFEKAAR